MTREEALAVATAILGEGAQQFDRVDDPPPGRPRSHWDRAINHVGRYWVGSMRYLIYGNGNTWEEALSAAEAMQQEFNNRASRA